jgi:hypothetical protein
MRVHFQFLRLARKQQTLLANDGWRLERERDESFVGRHREVSDEEAARNRLTRLGMLTSPFLCIEFQQPGLRDQAAYQGQD